MNNSRVIDLLRSLSKEEIKGLDRFIASPFSECPEFVARFYRELRKHYPKFDQKKVDKRKLFEKLYSGKYYNDGLMRRLISALQDKAEEFLVFNYVKNDKSMKSFILLNQFSDRKLERLFSPLSQKINKDKFVSEPFFALAPLNNYQLQTRIHNHELVNKKKRNFMVHNEAATESLLYFALERLMTFNRESDFFKHEHKVSSDLILLFNNNFNSEEFLRLYLASEHIYKDRLKLKYLESMLNSGEPSYYFEYKKALNKIRNRLTPAQLVNSYALMTGFCSAKDDSTFMQESFALRDEILREKLFLNNSKYLQLSFCIGMVNVCVRLEKYNYIKNFIADNADSFDPAYKDNLIYYAKGLLFFNERRFSEALEKFTQLSFERAVYRVFLKRYRIMCLYELGYFDTLPAECDYLKKLIDSSDSLDDVTIKKTSNFISILLKLVKLRSSKNMKKLYSLLHDAENEEYLNSKKWIAEKIKTLLAD